MIHTRELEGVLNSSTLFSGVTALRNFGIVKLIQEGLLSLLAIRDPDVHN